MTCGPAGPQLVDRIDADALARLWTAVTRVGGAVGFVEDTPGAEIRAAAQLAAAEVAAGREQLLVLGPPAAPVGTVFLRRGAGPRTEHGAEVVRLMVRPDQQGRGHGTALLDAAVAHATTLGREFLMLTARGGTDLPRYYAARGWTPVGVWPGTLRLGPGPDGLRDAHWFHLRLR
ncbi:GNAT family N-acetyltransferase [Pseudonocardia sp.]|uniref:GNAT family N-acetyltransferase n=1 Tax=Pseudonocardia sp. TaxID=60912 RepID=UPI0026053F63|nr:GNAT family N-acetyltransferase [Pseudonocardia sp.]